jgi:hypothetical protein
MKTVGFTSWKSSSSVAWAVERAKTYVAPQNRVPQSSRNLPKVW